MKKIIFVVAGLLVASTMAFGTEPAFVSGELAFKGREETYKNVKDLKYFATLDGNLKFDALPGFAIAYKIEPSVQNITNGFIGEVRPNYLMKLTPLTIYSEIKVKTEAKGSDKFKNTLGIKGSGAVSPIAGLVLKAEAGVDYTVQEGKNDTTLIILKPIVEYEIIKGFRGGVEYRYDVADDTVKKMYTIKPYMKLEMPITGGLNFVADASYEVGNTVTKGKNEDFEKIQAGAGLKYMF